MVIINAEEIEFDPTRVSGGGGFAVSGIMGSLGISFEKYIKIKWKKYMISSSQNELFRIEELINAKTELAKISYDWIMKNKPELLI